MRSCHMTTSSSSVDEPRSILSFDTRPNLNFIFGHQIARSTQRTIKVDLCDGNIPNKNLEDSKEIIMNDSDENEIEPREYDKIESSDSQIEVNVDIQNKLETDIWMSKYEGTKSNSCDIERNSCKEKSLKEELLYYKNQCHLYKTQLEAERNHNKLPSQNINKLAQIITHIHKWNNENIRGEIDELQNKLENTIQEKENIESDNMILNQRIVKILSIIKIKDEQINTLKLYSEKLKGKINKLKKKCNNETTHKLQKDIEFAAQIKEVKEIFEEIQREKTDKQKQIENLKSKNKEAEKKIAIMESTFKMKNEITKISTGTLDETIDLNNILFMSQDDSIINNKFIKEKMEDDKRNNDRIKTEAIVVNY